MIALVKVRLAALVAVVAQMIPGQELVELARLGRAMQAETEPQMLLMAVAAVVVQAPQAVRHQHPAMVEMVVMDRLHP